MEKLQNIGNKSEIVQKKKLAKEICAYLSTKLDVYILIKGERKKEKKKKIYIYIYIYIYTLKTGVIYSQKYFKKKIKMGCNGRLKIRAVRRKKKSIA